ncbi:DUF507 family protein [Candidatus Aminicenantes bacterium AC-708-M15]|jgi:hypothetical protein|nr:DUF507 family protein [SCandidatus Aminicenantes bacterium Aminicenantia_JdfR_composite]MCP2604449.1 DUF507 family protein [Candidatus Aminicenantes bacterium AC-708-M15]MCP2605766.1 DUF507 family protein [Candidatus Aminicenantes bacterium AC-335-O07]MCP2618787.1 DUF507 family protein [Candidatus Aminicenantes bacterium AC-335-A11]MCP2620583.1 DUF507 family protein [Candidatus Aminicenantes bacterium AC-334-E05]
MRLSKNQIEHLAFNIVKTLINEEKIIVEDRNKLVEKIEKIITDEFIKEDELDEEVRKILSEHMDQIRKENIEYQTVFRMIKNKLAKERNIVL